MNLRLPKIGSVITAASVFLFALFMIVDFPFGSYFVCMLLPIGYIMTAAGFHHECEKSRKVPANLGMIFAAIYAVLIFLVYFAQTTTVRLEILSEEAARILDYRCGGLLFNYDLLGYGMMALSTFFLGLSLRETRKSDRLLRRLLMIHGIFFLSCFLLPMTGMFVSSSGASGSGGTIALLCWCAYFLPVAILSCLHFKGKQPDSEVKEWN